MIKKLPRKINPILLFQILLACSFFLHSNLGYSQVYFDESAPFLVKSIEGAATWTKDVSSGDFIYNNGGTVYSRRAMLYSAAAYQSNDGFKLTIEYTTGSIDETAAHNFSFGLISDETDLATYSGFNPFKTETSVYSIGVNLTTDDDITARGLNFTNGTSRLTLDQSGSRAQFATGATTKVTIEIGIGGYWSYRINDVYEASGVLVNGFDLTKSYQVAIYGQDDNGGGKSIQSITLEKRYAAGERAAHLKGTWNSEIDVDLLDDRIKNLKTLDRIGVSFTNGAVLSAQHYAPHKLFDMLAGGDAVAPAWGNLNSDTPQNDKMLTDILKIKAAGFNVKAYTNSENFVGTNEASLQPFVDSWIAYCDINPEIQAFINSQPYHTGIWNATTQQYEDATATYPLRKYMFCYAEYFLKDYALRYGKYFDSWIFDSGNTMESNGDNAKSGLFEEQRIYQAFANAVHAGNPEIPVAFNNGRSTVNYNAFPYAIPTRFDDFTFGHAFGGNNDHASKTGGQFANNYNYISRMTATDGAVHSGGNWTWDDKIVGNFHSKLSTAAWKYGATQAWEQDDFNQWNLEAMKAGGSMTWGGSYNRDVTAIYDWVYVLLEGMDNYLAANENPGAPNWARAHTILPKAFTGQSYSHKLREGIDFWDPEGDAMTLIALDNFPSWLSISKIADGVWELSGTPTETTNSSYEFKLQASDASGGTSRTVNLNVLDSNAIQVSGVAISKNNAYLIKDETLTLSAEVSPTNAVNKNIIWSSSAPTIASVDSNGLVKGLAVGNAIISATIEDGGFVSSCMLTVVDGTNFNLALIGTATQSSTDFGAVASRAIDGNTDGTFGNGSVTHTLTEVNPWWQVDLGYETTIGTIKLFNRLGSNYTRLSNYTLSIYNASGVPVYSETFAEAPNLTTSINVGGVRGQIVKIQLNNTNPLSLAEVEVYKESNLSVNKITEKSIIFYPNPAKDVLNYDLKEGGRFTHLVIYSISGQQIASYKIDNSTGQINLKGIERGGYILKAFGDSTIVSKFIKE
ncbi:Ig-like domain-containing protein [Flavobacterium sp. NG2]|uniref:Ig-like domain-containing protein n=1 Tax=Flavobacterium sp. NG2 TaxID=3097547 RepID=UPI002A820351|nr:Ig-like domain-containing protein [Flavobacterium sp. NG2]WPR73170.1 Ig-like domain-containing protein [Flavobacterium sp. NG2]